MRTYNEAKEYSKQNHTELVEFKELDYNGWSYLTGFFLKGEREGVFEHYRGNKLIQRDMFNSKTSHAEHLRFRDDGSISRHFFRRCDLIHGEYKWFNSARTVDEHYFYNSGKCIEELNDVVNEERDEAFYFTLSLYDIDSEYTFN